MLPLEINHNYITSKIRRIKAKERKRYNTIHHVHIVLFPLTHCYIEEIMYHPDNIYQSTLT